MRFRKRLRILRAVSGEGNYHGYRNLRGGRRLFLFAKHARTTLNYWIGAGSPATTRTVAFVKGANQLRHHNLTASLRETRLGPSALYSDQGIAQSPACMLPRIPFTGVARQFAFLLLMVISGRKRYLTRYYLDFYSEIENLVARGLKDVDVFVCYNDQPFDIAAIVSALNDRGGCRTIVIQHGLILSPLFYFPCNAREFWAWGELSRKHYLTRHEDGEFLVTGRCTEDLEKKNTYFEIPRADQPRRILVAFSHSHDEFKAAVRSLVGVSKTTPMNLSVFSYKLHPATKFPVLLRGWIRLNAPWLREETETVEIAADQYDALFTCNSTTAVDFLLRGKPVFFSSLRQDVEFPSYLYGRAIADLVGFVSGRNDKLCSLNEGRIQFLRHALNV